MYSLGEKPSGSNEAYDALNTVFGGGEFSARDAADALVEVLEMSESDAERELNTLYRTGALVEA